MQIFNIELETSVRLLSYNDSEQFYYEQIESIQSFDEKFNLSALIELKQDKVVEENIDVFIVHILGEGTPTEDGGFTQKLSKLPLGQISLNPQSTQAFRPEFTLIKDKWKFKQLIKWNFEGIPSHGPGTYALALTAPSKENKEVPIIIDCAYFKIK